MAIFNSSNVPSSGTANSNTTIITSGAKIKGEIEISCNLYIDGELEGGIKSSKEVNIGKNGKVKGTITTSKLIVQGYVDGVVDASRVEIKSAGRVRGEITSKELVIEAKGIFEGTSVVKDSKSSEGKAKD